MRIPAICLSAAATLAAAFAIGAPAPPLAGVWNIAPTGRAGTSGELVFRITHANGSDPVDITVPVIMGAREDTVARGIRNSLSSQLPPQNYDVQMGEGTNVLVSDPRGRPNFSLELVDSDIDELRVSVQSVTPAAPPTVPEQRAPAEPAPSPSPPAPGQTAPEPDVLPPPPQPTTSPPGNAAPVPQPELPPPGTTTPVPQPSTPPPASAPPPGGAGAMAPPG